MQQQQLPQFTTKHPPLLEIYQRSFRENFDLPCLTDYNTGETLTYGDFACRIARLHLLYKRLGIRRGDHIALLGKNNINWVVVFMGTITYGAVIVPILSEFNPRDAQQIVRHSDSVMLFVSDSIWANLEPGEMPQVRSAISLDNMRALASDKNTNVARVLRGLSRAFRSACPNGFSNADIKYGEIDETNTAIINYTSGTTGFSKGVMLPLRSLWGNVVYGIDSKLQYKGSRALSFLPLAHAYGCAFDMLVPLAVGTHITILGRAPTPRILTEAMAKVRPTLVICVPLVLEKIYRKMIVPLLAKPAMRWALAIPYLDRAIFPRIRNRLIEAFGGEFQEVIVGGAPLNAEVEDFLHRIKFPFTVGYGMTECGPLISHTFWKEFIPGSSGRTLPGLMTAKILADKPGDPGEIVVKGVNVMSGYYKKPDVTADTLDEDGWLHTGDMGTLGGPDGQTIFIRGRYKTMILTGSGQNIYPEEIEGKLNNMPFVAESLVVERGGHLEALVVPDTDEVEKMGLSLSQLREIMEKTRRELNTLVAPYERVERIEIMPEEFEKTPKRSIKRYLYK